MPSQINNHLEWVDITDFSAGLWSTSGGFLMPAEGFQTMTDCYPQPGGGLRAFYKPEATTVTNLTTTARVVAMDCFTSAVQSTFMLLSIAPATGRLTAWTRTASASSWTSSKVFNLPAAANQAYQADICQYVDNADSPYFVVATANYVGESGTGIWLYNINAGTWAQVSGTAGITGPVVAMYQSRIITRGVGDYGQNNRLMWTDPGAITFAAANYIDFGARVADSESALAGFAPYSPSNLMVATATSWYTVQGDLGDPVVTEMGKGHAPNIAHGQSISPHDAGPIFVDANAGVFVAQNNGSAFDQLDKQLTPYNPPSIQASFGITVYKDFVFAPSGRVMDLRTGAWFNLSVGIGSTPIDRTYALRYDHDGYGGFTSPVGLYAPQWADTFAIYRYVIDEAVGDASGRYSTYTVKTAPLRRPDGRQVNLREVQVMVKGFAAGDDVAVTVNGTTRTATDIGVGINVLTFTFNERAEYLDVQVVPTAASTGEAPIIEAIRVGFRPDGHRLR